eukprot:7800382-Pyramimonas_sp.AAC.1
MDDFMHLHRRFEDALKHIAYLARVSHHHPTAKDGGFPSDLGGDAEQQVPLALDATASADYAVCALHTRSTGSDAHPGKEEGDLLCNIGG